jgi:ribonuclease HII
VTWHGVSTSVTTVHGGPNAEIEAPTETETETETEIEIEIEIGNRTSLTPTRSRRTDPAGRSSAKRRPTLPRAVLERRLIREGARLVAGVDEVGRGAWAGPVSVGVALMAATSFRRLPAGVKDSKLLSPAQRERLFTPLAAAVVGYAVGHASSEECDALGMTAAQRLATDRAFAALGDEPDEVIVDGKFDFTGHPAARCVIGADRTSIVVAAASVLAKVTRDRLMVGESPSYPNYHFEINKGYPSPDHKAALARDGLSRIHRHSWSFAADYPA